MTFKYSGKKIKFSDEPCMDLYAKLSTSNGEVIQDSKPYILKKDGNGKMKFENLTDDDIQEEVKSNNNMNDYMIWE